MQESTTHVYAGGMYPPVTAFDWLVVMGGPMGVYDADKHSWMISEKRLLEEAIKAGKVVIGVCLGSQLVAEALGARVYKARYKEIGWYPVALTESGADHPLTAFFPKEFTAFHWHGDVFDLPAHSLRLLTSERTPNQAFVYNERVLGLQLHLELQQHDINLIIDNSLEELEDAPYIQQPATMRSRFEHITGMNRLLHRMLDELLAANPAPGDKKA